MVGIMKEFIAVVICGFVIIIVTAVQTGPGLHEWTDFLTKVEHDCMNRTGITKTTIELTKASLELPHTPQYKEYISCFYKKQGFQNEDGDILYYNIKNMISDLSNHTFGDEIVDSCKDMPKLPSHDENAYSVAKCLLGASKRYINRNGKLQD